MKLEILLASLLFAATSAKGVYVKGATTDSSGVEAVVAAAELGEDQRRMLGAPDIRDPCEFMNSAGEQAEDCDEEDPLDPEGIITTWWCYICRFNFLPRSIYDAHCHKQCEA